MRRPSIYVAASAAGDQTQRVAMVIAALKSVGFNVTCTWPEVVAATPGGANPRDASTPDRFQWSAQDLREIAEADALWFLVPTPPMTTRGAWFECGYAYAHRKFVVFSGDTKQSVFCALGHEFETDEDAFEHMKRWANEWRMAAGLAELERETR